MPVRRFSGFRWTGAEIRPYKNSPGLYLGVERQLLASHESAAFEARYFEVQPGGYTSFERHMHVHVVIVVRGEGEVLLDDATEPIGLFDIVEVGPMEPHQFRNTGPEPLGFLCIVDKLRDKPEPLGAANTVDTAERQTL